MNSLPEIGSLIGNALRETGMVDAKYLKDEVEFGRTEGWLVSCKGLKETDLCISDQQENLAVLVARPRQGGRRILFARRSRMRERKILVECGYTYEFI